jgi:hypothetical protein
MIAADNQELRVCNGSAWVSAGKTAVWETQHTDGKPVVPAYNPMVWTDEGDTDVAVTSGATAQLHRIDLHLPGKHLVLVLHDATVTSDTAGAWAKVTLAIDGTGAQVVHARADAVGEAAVVNINHATMLGAGSHYFTVVMEAPASSGGETASMAGTYNAGMGYTAARRLTVVAIPEYRLAAWAVRSGTTLATGTAGAFADVPDLQAAVTLREEAVVLSQLSMTVNAAQAAFRISVDGDAETRATQMSSSTSATEVKTVHLHRIDVLPAGTHTISGQWGDGTGTFTNDATADAEGRTLTVVALPTREGSAGLFTNPTSGPAGSYCSSGSGWDAAPITRLRAALPSETSMGRSIEEYVAVAFGDVTTVGQSAGGHKALRITLDGHSDASSTHASGSAANEHVHAQVHRAGTMGP